MNKNENKPTILDGINLGIGFAIGNILISIIIMGIILLMLNAAGIKINNSSETNKYNYQYNK